MEKTFSETTVSLRGQIPLGAQKLRGQHRTTCCTTQRIVREPDELPVEHAIGAQTAERDRLAGTVVAIESRLRASVVVAIDQEWPRRARQSELLRLAGVFLPRRQDLIARRRRLERYEHG